MGDSTEQMLAAAGIAFAVAIAAAALIDDRKTDAYLLGLAAFLLIAFVGALRAALRSAEGETAPLSATAVIGGSVVPVLYVTLAASYYNLRGDFEGEVNVEPFAFAASFPQAAVLAAAGTVMVQTGAVSAVLGRAGQALAPIQLALPLVLLSSANNVAIALALGLFAAWVAVAGALMLANAGAGTGADERPPAALTTRPGASHWTCPLRLGRRPSAGYLPQHRDRVALGLEHGVLDVTEVLTVGLERLRLVAVDLDPIEVVAVHHVSGPVLPAAEQRVADEARQRRRADAARRDEVEAEVEPGPRCDVQRQRSGERIRVGVGDERKGGPPQPLDLEHRLEPAAALDDRLAGGEHEPGVGRAPAVGRPSPLVDAAHQLGVKPDPGREREAPAVHPPERDAARTALFERPGEHLGRLHGIAWQPERPGEHARASARHEADGQRIAEPVEHLVEAAVAREDDDGVEITAQDGRELDRVAGVLRAHGRHLGDRRERALHGRRARNRSGPRREPCGIPVR